MPWKISKRSAAAILLPVLVSAALLALTALANARSGGIKYAADYSDMRGFNYNPISAKNGDDKWINFNHAEIDRDFGYAERLELNAVRMFLSYKARARHADRQGGSSRICRQSAGGDDWRTLFVTASTSLYAVGVKIGPHMELFMNA